MADSQKSFPTRQVISLTSESSLAGGTQCLLLADSSGLLQQPRHSCTTTADSLEDLPDNPTHTDGTTVARREFDLCTAGPMRRVTEGTPDPLGMLLLPIVNSQSAAAALSTAGQVGEGLRNDCVFLGHQSYDFAWKKISCFRYDTSKHIRACISYDGIHVFSFDNDSGSGIILSRGDPVLIDFIQNAVERNIHPNSFYLWMLGDESTMLRQAFSLIIN